MNDVRGQSIQTADEYQLIEHGCVTTAECHLAHQIDINHKSDCRLTVQVRVPVPLHMIRPVGPEYQLIEHEGGMGRREMFCGRVERGYRLFWEIKARLFSPML
ncbi:hypothetical protein J6590_057115 [Homalodisca vitripennis]|nr:hypothetical protein J6590_057115 [Homalodisca vitripennis]